MPFRTLVTQLSVDAPPTAGFQILGNLALLFPLGLLAQWVFPRLRRFRLFLITALAVAIGIELLQLLEMVSLIAWRSIDIDDIILNTSGALLGYGVWRLGEMFASRTAEPDLAGARPLPNPRIPQTRQTLD